MSTAHPLPAAADPVTEASAIASLFLNTPLPSDPRLISALYTYGYQLYQAARYEDASKVFLVLTMLDGRQTRFLMAYGKSMHQLGHFMEASLCYAGVYTLAPDDPQPLLLSAQCMAATGDTQGARDLLQEALVSCREAGDAAMAARAEQLIARLPQVRDKPSAD